MLSVYGGDKRYLDETGELYTPAGPTDLCRSLRLSYVKPDAYLTPVVQDYTGADTGAVGLGSGLATRSTQRGTLK